MKSFKLLLLIVAFSLPAIAQENAEMIFNKAISKLLVSNMELAIEQRISDKSGRVKEKSFEVLKAKFGAEEKTKITMLKPERAFGVTIIFTHTRGEVGIIEVYTPANGKTRKMMATPENTAMVGSDFSISNYASRNSDELIFKLLEQQEVSGKPCYTIEVRDKTKDTGESAKLLIEEDTYQIVKIESYDENGKMNSISMLSDYQPIKGSKDKFQPMVIHSEDYISKKSNEIKVLQITPRPNLTEDNFKLGNVNE